MSIVFQSVYSLLFNKHDNEADAASIVCKRVFYVQKTKKQHCRLQKMLYASKSKGLQFLL